MSNKTIQLSDNSYVWSLPLVIQPAGKGKIYLGNPQIRKFIVTDEKWHHLADILPRPHRVEQIAKLLQEKDSTAFLPSTANSEVRVLLMLLTQHGLIRGIDNYPLAARKITVHSALTSWISTNAAHAMVHPMVMLAEVIALFVSVIIPVSLPSFAPKPGDYFWHPLISVNLLSGFVITWGCLYLHELGHLVVAKAYGVSGRLGLSHRLLFVVVETSFDDIYKVLPRQRIAIFSAGIGVDFLIIAISYGILSVQSWLLLTVPYMVFALIRQLVLLQWLAIAWQFFFFMKTDIYFIAKEFLQIENLYSLALARIRQWFMLEKSTSILSFRDSLIVTCYSVFVVIGTLIAIVRYMVYNIPITLILIFLGAQKVFSGVNMENPWVVADGAIVLFLEFLYFSLLAVAFTRQKSQSPEGGFRSVRLF